MRVVKPGPDRETPRGLVGGAEISQATVDASNIYMGRYRVPPGSRSRPHYHDGCESALYLLTGGIRILWGDHLEQSLELAAGDMLYVPPRVTHVVENTSADEPADYVVARDSPQEDAVVVPWADEAA
jgi:uncharacterized RmlC-like cupin family protein